MSSLLSLYNYLTTISIQKALLGKGKEAEKEKEEEEEEEEEEETEEKKKGEKEKRNYDFFLTAISRFYVISIFSKEWHCCTCHMVLVILHGLPEHQ